MCFESPYDNFGNVGNSGNAGNSPPKIPPKQENVRKADIIITFLNKEQHKETKEIQSCMRGIKTTVYGYIEYSTYSNQYTVKDVMKKLELIFNPFDKAFDLGFIGVPLSDGKLKFIAKESIVDINVQIDDYNEEVNELKVKSSGYNDYGHR